MNHNFKRYYFLTVEIKNIIILWLMQGIFFDQPVKMIEEHIWKIETSQCDDYIMDV